MKSFTSQFVLIFSCLPFLFRLSAPLWNFDFTDDETLLPPPDFGVYKKFFSSTFLANNYKAYFAIIL